MKDLEISLDRTDNHLTTMSTELESTGPGESGDGSYVSLSNNERLTNCPACGKVFSSTMAVCLHLQDDLRCGQHLLPTPSAFRVPPKSHAPRVGQYHPKSGYIYDMGQLNTLERMRLDEYEPK